MHISTNRGVRAGCLATLSVALATVAVGAHAETPRGKAQNGHSELGIVALNTTNLDRAVSFYKVLGFQEGAHKSPADGRKVLMNVDSATGKFIGGITLHEIRGPLMEGNSYGRMVILVRDVRGLCQRLAEAKTPCTEQPTLHKDHANAIIGMATDPDKRVLELLQPGGKWQ